jgi:hypothetical protein
MKIQSKHRVSGGAPDLYSYKKKMVGNPTFKMSDWLKRRQEQGKSTGYGTTRTKFLIISKLK